MYANISHSFKHMLVFSTFRRETFIIQDVPGVKVTILGFNSRADSESKISYTHGSNLQRFGSYKFLKYSK
jgi:hypothetical protein